LQFQTTDDNSMADIGEISGDGDDDAGAATLAASESSSATAMDTTTHTVVVKRPRLAAANTSAPLQSAVASASAPETMLAYVSAREATVQSALRWRKRVRVTALEYHVLHYDCYCGMFPPFQVHLVL
jgi:hypothetical protein